jgi:pSer/pThr/pTyr-binding forkhead associated (FHA) protein
VGGITGRAGGSRPETRETGGQPGDRIYAEIRYEDDSGPQLYLMTQDEISVGRGGDGAQVSLALYTNDEVSREHLRVRRDTAQKRFVIVDQSMNGTWLNGRRLQRGVEVTLPGKAQISVAEVITLQFEERS